MKWIRQYEGPFLVIKVPSSVTAIIQRTAKAKPKTVHIDKLKKFVGKPPKKWTSCDEEFVDEVLPLVGAPFDGRKSSPTNEVEVIRPLPKDKTNEYSPGEWHNATSVVVFGWHYL